MCSDSLVELQNCSMVQNMAVRLNHEWQTHRMSLAHLALAEAKLSILALLLSRAALPPPPRGGGAAIVHDAVVGLARCKPANITSAS